MSERERDCEGTECLISRTSFTAILHVLGHISKRSIFAAHSPFPADGKRFLTLLLPLRAWGDNIAAHVSPDAVVKIRLGDREQDRSEP